MSILESNNKHMKNEKTCAECDNRRVIMGFDDEQGIVPVVCPDCIDDWSDFEKDNGAGEENINFKQE